MSHYVELAHGMQSHDCISSYALLCRNIPGNDACQPTTPPLACLPINPPTARTLP
ncbi:hypothetical protein PISMIDRAFT_678058, partial [Pisolithus microcarpus 441]